MDEWYNMSIEDVRDYEREMQEKTNIKVNFFSKLFIKLKINLFLNRGQSVDYYR